VSTPLYFNQVTSGYHQVTNLLPICYQSVTRLPDLLPICYQVTRPVTNLLPGYHQLAKQLPTKRQAETKQRPRKDQRPSKEAAKKQTTTRLYTGKTESLTFHAVYSTLLDDEQRQSLNRGLCQARVQPGTARRHTGPCTGPLQIRLPGQDHPTKRGQQATPGPIKEVAMGIALEMDLEIVLGASWLDPRPQFEGRPWPWPNRRSCRQIPDLVSRSQPPGPGCHHWLSPLELALGPEQPLDNATVQPDATSAQPSTAIPEQLLDNATVQPDATSAQLSAPSPEQPQTRLDIVMTICYTIVRIMKGRAET